MKTYVFSVCGMILLLLNGCAGVTFDSAAINTRLPDGMKYRTIYPDGAQAYEIEELLGNVLHEKNVTENITDPKTGQTTQKTRKKYDKVGVVLPDSYNPVVQAIKDPLMYYRSKIDQGAAVQGSYLVAANVSGSQLTEITISDSALSSLPTSKFPEDKIVDYVKNRPNKPAGVEARLWVRSVILSRVVYSDFTQIKADAKNVASEAVGVSGNVYRKQEGEIKDVMIGMDTFDIDELAKQIEASRKGPQPKAVLSPEEYQKVVDKWLNKSRVTAIIKGKIE